MHWQIRRGKPEDLDDLRRIYFEARTNAFFWLDTSTFKPEDFDLATQNEAILVAVLDNKLIGFVSWWMPDHFIHNLYVDPRFTTIGVGKALLQECLSKIGRPATLKCLQQNTNAVLFYIRQDWRVKSEGISDEGPYFLMTYSQ